MLEIRINYTALSNLTIYQQCVMLILPLKGSVQLDCYWNTSLYSPSSSNEPDSSENKFQKFPCVVFSHGLGGSRCVYSSFCLELASYGYIVAAVEHRSVAVTMTQLAAAQSPR